MRGGTEEFKDFQIQNLFSSWIAQQLSQQKDRLEELSSSVALSNRKHDLTSHAGMSTQAVPLGKHFKAVVSSRPMFALTILKTTINNHQLGTYLAKHGDLHGFTLDLPWNWRERPMIEHTSRSSKGNPRPFGHGETSTFWLQRLLSSRLPIEDGDLFSARTSGTLPVLLQQSHAEKEKNIYTKKETKRHIWYIKSIWLLHEYPGIRHWIQTIPANRFRASLSSHVELLVDLWLVARFLCQKTGASGAFLSWTV